MRKLIILFILIVVFSARPVWSGDKGRYQATAMGDSSMVFILDTEQRHFWIVISPMQVMYGGQLSTEMEKGKRYKIIKHLKK